MKYGDRLRSAMQFANLKQYQLAELVGIKQPSISHLINDPNVSGSEFTVQFATACGVRPEWLATEQGDMLASTHEVREPLKTYDVRDPVLDDLAALEPEDADVWRAQIKAAAIKARKLRQEMKDRNPSSGPGDPNSKERRTA